MLQGTLCINMNDIVIFNELCESLSVLTSHKCWHYYSIPANCSNFMRADVILYHFFYTTLIFLESFFPDCNILVYPPIATTMHLYNLPHTLAVQLTYFSEGLFAVFSEVCDCQQTESLTWSLCIRRVCWFL